MSLNRMVIDLAVKGKKAMVSILSSLYPYGNLSKTRFFKLFDVNIAPILLYGSELWGTKMYDSLERVHRYACKRFLNVSFKVCYSFALGNCGRFPLYKDVCSNTGSNYNTSRITDMLKKLTTCYTSFKLSVK